MNADAVAVLRLLTCCHGHVGTVVAVWGPQHHYVDTTVCRLVQRGFLAPRKTGALRRGYYDPTAAGLALLDHDNRLGFERLADEYAEQEPHHAET
jgi:hypothetical protein